MRFGYDYFEAFCERHNTELIVVNGDSLSLYKSEQHGGYVQIADRWYASSKTCHACGWVKQELTLAIGPLFVSSVGSSKYCSVGREYI